MGHPLAPCGSSHPPSGRYALCEEEVKKPMAMKLVCTGEDERIVGLHVIGFAAGAQPIMSMLTSTPTAYMLTSTPIAYVVVPTTIPMPIPACQRSTHHVRCHPPHHGFVTVDPQMRCCRP